LKARKLAGWPDEATKIRKPVLKKDFDNFRADKTAGASHQNPIAPRKIFRRHGFEFT